MKKSLLSILLGLLLSAAGVIVAALSVKGSLRIVEVWPIVVGGLVTLAVWIVQGTALAVLSRNDVEANPVAERHLLGLPILKTTRVYLVTQAVGAITPFAGGEVAAQIMELKRLGLPADKGSAVATVRAIANVTSLAIGAVIGLFFVSHVPFVGRVEARAHQAQNAGILWPLAGVFVGVVALLAAGGFAVRRWRKRRERQRDGHAAEHSTLSSFRERLARFFRNYRDDLLLLWQDNPKGVVAAFLLMAVFWLLYPLLGVLGLLAAGWSGEHWIAVFTAQYILFLVIPFAPTPGNSGAAEVAFVALMNAYVGHGSLLAGVIVWRFLNHYSELITGALLAGPSIWDDIKIAREELASEKSD